MPQKAFQFGDARLSRIPDKHVLGLFSDRAFNVVVIPVFLTWCQLM